MIKPEELNRYQLMGKVFDKSINQQEAAELLGLSDRQVRRIVRRVRAEGERGVIHRLRGRRGCRRIADAVRSRILGLYLVANYRKGVSLNDCIENAWQAANGEEKV